MDKIKIRGHVLFEPNISLIDINSSYNKFLKAAKYPLNRLDDILKKISRRLDGLKYYSSEIYIAGNHYTKLIFLGKAYILFPWNIDKKILISKKENERDKKTDKLKKVEITKEEEKRLETILAEINEALKLATK